MEQIINWIEIPAADLARAKKFYENAFDMKFSDLEIDGATYAVANYKGNEGLLALAKSPNHTPASQGIMIYLNAGPDMTYYTDKIGKAGGQVVMPKTFVNEMVGNVGVFVDSEGNSLGLHHM